MHVPFLGGSLMKEVSTHKIPITIAETYPPYDSGTPGSSPQPEQDSQPKGTLIVDFQISHQLISAFPHVGISARHLREAPKQQIVVSILAPHGGLPLWRTTFDTEGELQWLLRFDDKEKKAVGQHFQKGNTLQVVIAGLKDLQLSISLVTWKA
jgi:hypothetical protein